MTNTPVTTTSLTFHTDKRVEDGRIAIDFEYDEETNKQIKSTPFPKTEYEFDSNLSMWTAEQTEESLTELENALNFEIPQKHWPTQPSPDELNEVDATVSLTIEYETGWVRFDSLPDSLETLLIKELTYKDPDAKHTEAYQNGDWDGRKCLYSKRTKSIPIGLLDRVLELFNERNHTVNISEKQKQSLTTIHTNWNATTHLHDYQQEAVRETIANDGGIITLPGGDGRTTTALRLIYELNHPTLILVNSTELLEHWGKHIKETLDVTPGIVGGDVWNEKQITIATLQKLQANSVADLTNNYNITIFDNCHETAFADEMREIGRSINTNYRIGLSAIPWESLDDERLLIEGTIGAPTYGTGGNEITQLIKNGQLANPRFEMIDPHDFGVPNIPNGYRDYSLAYSEYIVFDPARLRATAAKALNLAEDGETTLIHVDQIIHGELLAWLLNDSLTADHLYNIVEGDNTKEELLDDALSHLSQLGSTNAMMISSQTPESTTNAIMENIESGEQNIIISTSVLNGAHATDINALIVAHGLKSDTETIQAMGQALDVESEETRIIDIEDRGRYFRKAHRERLQTLADYYNIAFTTLKENTPMRAVPIDQLPEDHVMRDGNSRLLVEAHSPA